MECILTIGLGPVLYEYLTTELGAAAELSPVFQLYDGLRQLTARPYGLIIVGLSVAPGTRGADTIAALRCARAAPILAILSGATEPRAITELLENGADACLPDTTPPSVLAEQAKALIRRYRVFNHYDDTHHVDGTVIYRDGLMIDPARRKVLVNNQTVKLTPREFELLYYLASNPGIVLTKAMIQERVWHVYDLINLSSTIARLRHKIEPNPRRPVYILTEYGVGYRFVERTGETCDIS